VGLLVISGIPRTAAAADDEGSETLEHLIPPGQDELLAAMLGSDAVLPGGCRFVDGSAQGSMVAAEYACGDGTVTLEWRHPDDAPAGALRTERFAIVPRAGAPPPGLLEALAALTRAREEEFHWKERIEPRSTSPRLLGVVAIAVAVAAIAIVGLALQFVVRRVLPTPGSWPRWAVAQRALALGSALALCALVHGVLRASGALASAILRGGAGAPAGAALLAVLVPAAMGAATLTAWCARRRLPRVCVGLTIVAYVGIGYWMSLLPNDLHYFGAVSTLPPNTTSAASATAGPSAVVYRTNAFGFREPPFASLKPNGAIRVALIGDSYVYGTGVSEDGTLRARLAEELARRWPGRLFEVLNLGIPGDNLGSHVDLFAATMARLQPDAVVLCLTLANDLSRWDEQVERQDARRVGLFSFVRFLVGDAAGWLWAAFRLETTVTPAGLAFLDQQIGRIEAIRGTSGPRVLLFFGFHEWDPAITERLQRIPDTALVPDGLLGPDDFIPGDGHPTAVGNTRSARRIADALADDPAWRALLAPPTGRGQGSTAP
jgi:hypothetical protein